MFGILPFGTIRFGESPAAVSPVLLSGVDVQGAGVVDVKVSVEKTLAAPQEIGVGASGLVVATHRTVRTIRRQESGTRNARLLIVPRLIGIATLDPILVSHRLSVAKSAASKSEASDQSVVHIRPIVLFDCTNTVGTIASSTISGTGLIAIGMQPASMNTRTVIERRLVSDNSTSGASASVGILVATHLVSSSVAPTWIELSITPGGLLILNVQSSEMHGILRTGRGLRSKTTEPLATASSRPHVVRTLMDLGSGFAGARGLVRGTGLTLRAAEHGIVLAELPILRGIRGRNGEYADAWTAVSRLRFIRATEGWPSAAVCSIAVYRALTPYELASTFQQAIVGRTCTIHGFAYEEFVVFGRFAVVPDLRNDRLVVILREDRRVMIPRQSEQ